MSALTSDLPDIMAEHRQTQQYDFDIPHTPQIVPADVATAELSSRPWERDIFPNTSSSPWKNEIEYIENCGSISELKRFLRTQRTITNRWKKSVFRRSIPARQQNLILSAKKRLRILGHNETFEIPSNPCADDEFIVVER